MTQALLQQLRAELSAHDQTVTSIARQLDRNYDTIRRYVMGERDMPLEVLWSILDALDVDAESFMRRTRERLS
jgi:transcriptional regulator with XRE-family HTH domain